MGHVLRGAPVPFPRVMVLIVLPAGIVPTGADPKFLIGQIAIKGDYVIFLLVLLDCPEVIMVRRKPYALSIGVVVSVSAGSQRIKGEVEP